MCVLNEYYEEAIGQSLCEIDAFGALTSEQIAHVAKDVIEAKEHECMATGEDVADQNWQAEQLRNAKYEVLAEVQSIISDIDGSPAMFNAATEFQKEGLAKLFNLQHWLNKNGKLL